MAKTVLVTGDRLWTNRDLIYQALDSLPTGSVVVHGAARGADILAGAVALELGLDIHLPPTTEHPLGGYPANWTQYGRSAGPRRNRQMLLTENPDEVWAFHNKLWTRSKGTRDMVAIATAAGVPVCLFTEYEAPHYINQRLE